MAEHKALQGINTALGKKNLSGAEKAEVLALCQAILDHDATVAVALVQVLFERLNGGGIEAFVRGICILLHITPYTEAVRTWYEELFPIIQTPLPSALLKGDPAAEARARRYYQAPPPGAGWH